MTTETATRAQILTALEDAQASLRAAVTGLPDAQMTPPVLGAWSIKDILAHVAGWDELGTRDFHRIARGHTPILAAYRHEDVDAWNAGHLRGRALFPPAQMLAELDAAADDLHAALRQMPDDAFADGGLVRTFCDIGIQHKRGHADQIQAWRQAQNA